MYTQNAAQPYPFSRETLLVIEYYEKKFETQQVYLEKEEEDNRIRWVKELISLYDQNEQPYMQEMKEKNVHKDYINVCKILDRGKVPNNIKSAINPKPYKGEKRCNIKKIIRTIHLLKIAQKMGKKAFLKFIKIPDINYVLNVIEKNQFCDLKYLFD